ncbi:MAG: hypothetical protein WEB00_15065 [Dehalococcoidia bacterium]
MSQSNGGSADIPAELLAKGAPLGWTAEVIQTVVASGVPLEGLEQAINAGMTPEVAARFAAGPPPLDLGWMKVPTEWGIRVRPGKHGLRMHELNVGTYADIPDVWQNQTEMPRGAFAIEGVTAMGYSVYEKQELWADNAGELYEEAIQRRWSPAVDVPWASLEPLPDDIERAICQICTELSERGLLVVDVLGKWLPDLSYGYHEVKTLLATQIFEGGRAFEVFRKRALANGGGLGLQSPGIFSRAIFDARNFSEMSVLLHILHTTQTLVFYKVLGRYAHNEAESTIFRYGLQDAGRHLAYGMEHLRFMLNKRPDRRAEMHTYLQRGEQMLELDWQKDTPLREALAIVIGGGVSNINEGLDKLGWLRKMQVEHYLAALDYGRLIDRREKLSAPFRQYLEEPQAVPA